MEFVQNSLRLLKVFVCFILLVVSAPDALGTTVGEITQALTCTCGCNMVVGACEGSMECTAAKHITDEVAQLVAKGQSKDQIIRYFVEKNGERILAAPTKKGFNLTAWILPFFAIILGGGIVYIFLTRCLIYRESRKVEMKPLDEENEADKKYLDQLETELKDFELTGD